MRVAEQGLKSCYGQLCLLPRLYISGMNVHGEEVDVVVIVFGKVVVGVRGSHPHKVRI